MATQVLLPVPAGIGQSGIPDPYAKTFDVQVAGGTNAIALNEPGDTNPRFAIGPDGAMGWGPGNAALGTFLAWAAAQLLTVTGQVRITPTGVAQVALMLDAQGTDIQQWLSGGTVRSFVDNFGNLTVRSNTRLDAASLSVLPSTNVNQAVVVQAVASMATDVVRVKDSTTATQFAIDSGFNVVVGDGKNLIVGTGTGTKIGTATTQKIGFFGAAPVVRRGTIAAPTAPGVVYSQAEAASNVTAVNALRQALIDFGLIAP